MTFPLIQECKEQVISRFETYWIKNEVEYEIRIFNFDMPMEFYSNLIGYVKVSLIKKDPEPDRYLKSIINGPMLDCYPRAYSKINLNELPELQKSLEFNSKIGDRPSYLRVVDDKLRIYSNY
ncbi:MAG: hypothetical protein OQK82_01900 [Candidatus Pacearchaeota archaeon]|nr:hypothetical protein [Candidatus Pacearchaeota archaeon]